MKFRKKPVVIEAVQWTGDNTDEILAFTQNNPRIISFSSGKVHIVTLEDSMKADINDWIICGVENEYSLVNQISLTKHMKRLINAYSS